MYKHIKKVSLITDNLKVNKRTKIQNKLQLAAVNCSRVLNICQNREERLQQQFHFNRLFPPTLRQTINSPIESDIFSFALLNGRFYVYLKRSLIGFKFVSFLPSGDFYFFRSENCRCKGRRNVIVKFYLIYFNCVSFEFTGEGRKTFSN